MSMISSPLVSVICLCYNHEKYVLDALRSVVDQDYPNVELIIVDDASSDDSVHRIMSFLPGLQLPHKFISLKENVGNCAAFNIALEQAKGKYVIDLAADDLLETQRISIGAEKLESLGEAYGVHYGDAQWIDADGSSINLPKPALPDPFQEDVYISLIQYYWINPASMMMTKSCLDSLGGYDEKLSYEDFDFWIRSSRDWKYVYSDQILAKKRILNTSLGRAQNHWRNKHQLTTLQVCQKIKKLNRSQAENRALIRRILYEMKQCIRRGNMQLLIPYSRLLFSLL